jgi:hypothetical protein
MFSRISAENLYDAIRRNLTRHAASSRAFVLRRWRSFSLWAGRYLILDVRDKEAYDEGHIDGALHYPKTMLSRGSNELLPGAPPFATPATLAVVGGGVACPSVCC